MTTIPTILETMEYGPAPESAELAFKWLDGHARSLGHFIGGRPDRPEGAEVFESRNPASGEALASLVRGTPEDIDRAVQMAASAAGPWWTLSGHRRARVLHGIARGVQRHDRLLAVLETLDSGKPIVESRELDIPLVARHFYRHASWAQLLEREFPGMQPHGVAGQVIRWDSPLLGLARTVAPALAAGNTVVLKPSEHTSLTALLFAELCVEAGVPDGVVNVVTGDGRTGAELVGHPIVHMVAFTGTTEVGREIRRSTAGQGKRLLLEVGGTSCFLVFDDADLDSVVEGVVDAIWRDPGPVFPAGSRVLVQESVAEDLEAKLRHRMESLRMGDPLDQGIDLGATVAPGHLERMRSLVDEARNAGGEIWQPTWAVPEDGPFYPPTLCTGVELAGRLAEVEVFGPVAAMTTFRTPGEGVGLVNRTGYVLAASIWTENVSVALDAATAIRAETVWVNSTDRFDAAFGSGGCRQSESGRESGRDEIREYLRPGEAQSPDQAMALHRPATTVHQAGDGRTVARRPSESISVDRTPRLYIGGRQVQADGGLTMSVRDPSDQAIAEVPHGTRKDVHRAVEAARAAQTSWAGRDPHERARALYRLAENIDSQAPELASRLARDTGLAAGAARTEVARSVDRLFTSAALADKYNGRVQAAPFRNVTLAMIEPLGVLAIAAPMVAPLLGLVSTIAPVLAMGSTVVALPSPGAPLVGRLFYQLLDTSDVPAGVVNLLTGPRPALVDILAGHADVDGIWSFGDADEGERVERHSAGNLKRCWVPGLRGEPHWLDPVEGAAEELLRRAIRIKTVRIAYGA